jgi:hypothetical protein
MKAEVMTQEEVRTRGMEALKRELGTVGMVRFLQNFNRGKGDYTKVRHRWLNHLTLDDILGDLSALRKHARQPKGAAR